MTTSRTELQVARQLKKRLQQLRKEMQILVDEVETTLIRATVEKN